MVLLQVKSLHAFFLCTDDRSKSLTWAVAVAVAWQGYGEGLEPEVWFEETNKQQCSEQLLFSDKQIKISDIDLAYSADVAIPDHVTWAV